MMKDIQSGCTLFETTYLGTRMLVLENQLIRTGILLDFGAETIEFRYKPIDINIVWRTPLWEQNLKRRMIGGLNSEELSDNYLGGWFDIFPNIGAECCFDGKVFPAHGELLYRPWEYRIIESSNERIVVSLFTSLTRVSAEAEKILILESGSSIIRYDLRIKNTGLHAIPYQLGFHPSIGTPFLSEYCKIILSDEDIGCFPKQGSFINSTYMKEKIVRGECVVRNTQLKLDLVIKWNESELPNALIWISANNDYGHHLHGGAYVFCVLPRNDIMDGLSEHTLSIIEGGQEIVTSYSIGIEPEE